MPAAQPPVSPDPPSDPQRLTFDFLRQEYENLTKNVSDTMAQIVALITILITAIATIASYLLEHTINSPIALWLLPIAVLIIGGLVIHLLVRWSTGVFQIRLICERIIKVTQQPGSDFYYHPHAPASRFQSMRRPSKYRSMIMTLYVTVILLVCFLVIYAFLAIYQTNHLQGFVFALIMGALSGISLMGVYSTLFELPRLYDKAIERIRSGEPGFDSTDLARQMLHNSSGQFIPRPVDFYTKTWLFAAGMLAAGWSQGWSFNPRIADLFSTPKTVASGVMPGWTIFAFALCWYLVQELIVQQAKYAWNDLRDRKIDRVLSGKQDRAVAASNAGARELAAFILLRLAFGFALGYLLDFRLFVILAVLMVIQVFYELYVKPNAGRHPQLATTVVALGPPLRFLSGALAVSATLSLHFTLLAAIFFFFGVGYIAKYWKIEAENCRKLGKAYPPRPQSDFFIGDRGANWQHFGLVAMLLTSLLFLLGGLSCAWPDGCALSQAEQALRGLPLPYPATFIFFSVLVTALLALLTLPVYKKLARAILFIWRRKGWFIFSLAALALVSAILTTAHISPQPTLVWIGAIFLICSYLSIGTYEDMDYDQYLLVHLKKNARVIAGLWFVYFSQANTGITLAALTHLSIKLANANLEQVKDDLVQKGIDVESFLPTSKPSGEHRKEPLPHPSESDSETNRDHVDFST